MDELGFVVWFLNVTCVNRSDCKSFFRDGRGWVRHFWRGGRAAVVGTTLFQPAAAGAAHDAGLQEVTADILR